MNMKNLKRILAVGTFLLAIAGCGGSKGPIVMDESSDPWTNNGKGECVRVSSDGPVSRVINRTDPELCGLNPKVRPGEYVRVVPR